MKVNVNSDKNRKIDRNKNINFSYIVVFKLILMRYFLIGFFTSLCSIAQISLNTIKLPSQLDETSGLEYIGENLLTLNDSGDKARLYVFTKEGDLIKNIRFYNLKNKDWEDLAADQDHYYIADIGNNYATRENLRIYILDKNLIPKGTIRIKYKNQKTFIKETLNKFDAEALTVVGDNLVLFSKNRKTLQSEIYIIPKAEGDYDLTPSGIINTEALITSADYSKVEDLMVLTGYDFKGNQYFYTIQNFNKNETKNYDLMRYIIPVNSAQIEAVKIINKTEFWITSEGESSVEPRLFKLKLLY